MSTSDLQPSKIIIGGERFQIQTDLSAEELQEIITYIEMKMQEHLTPSLRAEPRKQLILMAMEIAADLFQTRKQVAELERTQERIAQTADHLADMLSSDVEAPTDAQARASSSKDPLEAAQAFLSPQ